MKNLLKVCRNFLGFEKRKARDEYNKFLWVEYKIDATKYEKPFLSGIEFSYPFHV